MILRPALRPLTGPRPPGDFAARSFAAFIRPPLLFFAMFHLLLDFYFSLSVVTPPSRGRLCNGIRVQGDGGYPCQRPAVQRRAGEQRNGLIRHDRPNEDRVDSD